jgi:hypothetical protein
MFWLADVVGFGETALSFSMTHGRFALAPLCLVVFS